MPQVSLPATVQRAISLIVVHCSATPSGKPIGPWDAATVIDGWHRQRGFQRAASRAKAFNPTLLSIGYHFVIDLDGRVLTGRHLDEIGAHVAGFNAQSIGICLVGGAERDARYTAAQWASLRELVLQLCALLRMPIGPVLERGKGVCGHRDLSPDTNHDGQVTPPEWLKTCPGFDVGAWVGRGLVPAPAHVIGGAHA